LLSRYIGCGIYISACKQSTPSTSSMGGIKEGWLLIIDAL